MADTHRPASPAHQLYVGDRDATLLLRNAAFYVALRIGTHVLLHNHDVFDQKLAIAGKHAQNTAFFAFVATGDYFHRIVAANVHSFMCGCCDCHFPCPSYVLMRDVATTVSTEPLAPVTRSSKTSFRATHGRRARTRAFRPVRRH